MRGIEPFEPLCPDKESDVGEDQEKKDPDKACCRAVGCDGLVDGAEEPSEQDARKSSQGRPPYDLELALSDPCLKIDDDNPQHKPCKRSIIRGQLKRREKKSGCCNRADNQNTKYKNTHYDNLNNNIKKIY